MRTITLEPAPLRTGRPNQDVYRQLQTVSVPDLTYLSNLPKNLFCPHAGARQATPQTLDELSILGQNGNVDWFRKIRGLKFVVIALYALAIVSLGFTHQTVSIAGYSPDLSVYALPDGSLPDICAGEMQTSDQQGIPQNASKGLCDACLLTSAPGTVLSGDCWTLVKQTGSRLLFRDTSPRRVVHAATHVPHLRGPPATA